MNSTLVQEIEDLKSMHRGQLSLLTQTDQDLEDTVRASEELYLHLEKLRAGFNRRTDQNITLRRELTQKETEMSELAMEMVKRDN